MKAAPRWLVIGGCSYELVSIGSRGRVPTLTALCQRYPALRLAILGTLGVHLYRRQA